MVNIPVTTTTKTFPELLRCKREAYCNTNERSTDNISLSSERRGTRSLQYKLEVYCDTFLRSSSWGFWHSFEAMQKYVWNQGIAKPMVCNQVAFTKTIGTTETTEMTQRQLRQPQNFKKRVECWISRNQGNHGNDKNHVNPVEIPEKTNKGQHVHSAIITSSEFHACISTWGGGAYHAHGRGMIVATSFHV